MNWRAHRHAPPPGSPLCRLDAVEDGGCLEVRCGDAADALSLIVMRIAGGARAYINVCPHFSLPLNAQAGEFLIAAPRRVMCAYHCAIFRFEDGACEEGPARGMALDAVPVEVIDGEVRVARSEGAQR
jgi:nitrite reductase/ring-hydroxylating ferredoxin subunit